MIKKAMELILKMVPNVFAVYTKKDDGALVASIENGKIVITLFSFKMSQRNKEDVVKREEQYAITIKKNGKIAFGEEKALKRFRFLLKETQWIYFLSNYFYYQTYEYYVTQEMLDYLNNLSNTEGWAIDCSAISEESDIYTCVLLPEIEDFQEVIARLKPCSMKDYKFIKCSGGINETIL